MGHIDMWAKILSEDTVLVGDLRERKAWIREHGFRVLVVPMPSNLFSFDKSLFDHEHNSLIASGETPGSAHTIATSFLLRNHHAFLHKFSHDQ